jgi:hypothetical protein
MIVLVYYKMTTLRVSIPFVEILEDFSCDARELGWRLSRGSIQMMGKVCQVIFHLSFASFHGS